MRSASFQSVSNAGPASGGARREARRTPIRSAFTICCTRRLLAFRRSFRRTSVFVGEFDFVGGAGNPRALGVCARIPLRQVSASESATGGWYHIPLTRTRGKPRFIRRGWMNRGAAGGLAAYRCWRVINRKTSAPDSSSRTAAQMSSSVAACAFRAVTG